MPRRGGRVLDAPAATANDPGWQWALFPLNHTDVTAQTVFGSSGLDWAGRDERGNSLVCCQCLIVKGKHVGHKQLEQLVIGCWARHELRQRISQLWRHLLPKEFVELKAGVLEDLRSMAEQNQRYILGGPSHAE